VVQADRSDAPAQDPAESFDIVLADGTPTGRTKPRAAVHRDGDWHRSVHVWVAGVDGAGGRFLTFQRRSPRKDTWPGRLDATVGGHFGAAEGLAEALREVEEEIGIAPPAGELRPLGVRVCANEAEPGVRDRELQSVLLWRSDRPLAAYRPNPAEVDALVRFPLPSVLALFAGERSSIDGEVLPSRAAEPETASFALDAFIPTVDGYFYRVAIAAAAALRGERYVAV